jgi:hypothetical protein
MASPQSSVSGFTSTPPSALSQRICGVIRLGGASARGEFARRFTKSGRGVFQERGRAGSLGRRRPNASGCARRARGGVPGSLAERAAWGGRWDPPPGARGGRCDGGDRGRRSGRAEERRRSCAVSSACAHGERRAFAPTGPLDRAAWAHHLVRAALAKSGVGRCTPPDARTKSGVGRHLGRSGARPKRRDGRRFVGNACSGAGPGRHAAVLDAREPRDGPAPLPSAWAGRRAATGAASTPVQLRATALWRQTMARPIRAGWRPPPLFAQVRPIWPFR